MFKDKPALYFPVKVAHPPFLKVPHPPSLRDCDYLRGVKTDATGGRDECRDPSTPQNDSPRESFCYAQDDNLELILRSLE